MPTVNLTDRFCSSAKTLAGVRTDYFDETVSGLALRVTPNGHRSWSYTFTSPRDGKRARVTMGTYPATSLAGARGKAIEARAHVEAGNDPRLLMRAQGAADMTVAALVDAYFADPEKTKRRTNDEIERRMRKNVVPMIGEVRLEKLRRRDVRTCVDPILRRNRPVEAARVFEDVRAMIRWAIEQEYIEANPLDGMKKLGGGTPRNRVLNDEEIATLWRGLPKSLARSKQCQAIVRLCLVTAQRVGEVAGMEKAELDLSAREWRLPGARTKNGHSHVVPLSDLAITIIKNAIEASGDSAYVFPCPVKAKLIEGRPARDAALTPIAVARTILRANGIDDDRPLGRFGIAPWSAHDLRRTALTGMARLGVAPIVLGHVANHRTTTKAGITLAVYSHYEYGPEKRAALDTWAERLEAVFAGNVASVVQIGRGGA